MTLYLTVVSQMTMIAQATKEKKLIEYNQNFKILYFKDTTKTGKRQ